MTRSSRVDGWARADPGGLAALADNWLLMAVRGLLAILFGLVMIFWRRPVLDALILSFASYAVLDGIVAISSALRAAARPMLGWPVVLEGVVSILLGGLALVWPFMPHGLIRVIAAWGLLTGILEIAMAVRVPRQHSVHWLLGTGGGRPCSWPSWSWRCLTQGRMRWRGPWGAMRCCSASSSPWPPTGSGAPCASVARGRHAEAVAPAGT